MNIAEQKAEFMINLLTAKIAEVLAVQNGKTVTDSLRDFLATKTSSLLFRPQSYLYLESPEYILDMLDAEYTGDIDRWLEV
ncbi:MAG: hypothetical protein LBR83_02025 [Clostridiales bacterium]|jgi:hypothetical protein|nr:hypothetical protein [Clostridiales bacterium]